MIENKEVSKRISDLMIKYAAEINQSVILVQDNCDKDEFVKYRTAAGKKMAEMLTEVMNPLYKMHPDIKPEKLD